MRTRATLYVILPALTLLATVLPSCGGAAPNTVGTASITVTPATATLAVGATRQLSATVTAADGSTIANPTLAWSSSSPAVATVDQAGLATGVAAGTATISVVTQTLPGVTGQAALTVSAGGATALNKWDLWSGGVELRGVNIWQGRADDPIYEGVLGPGPYGPTFSQQDFSTLAAAGCNFVNISHPGLYTLTPPYTLDTAAKANLDDLLAKIAQADMFAVITMRTGPGRSEWTFHWGNDTTTDPTNGWFPASYYNETVWQQQAAQDAWAAMWGYMAGQYASNDTVVAYDLMCEPNSNQTQHNAGDPGEFYPARANTLADWNQFFPDIITAIRAVDANTPIIVGGMGYSGVDWLPYIQPSTDTRVVYAVHQYEPGEYTHQEANANVSYPGTIGGEQVNQSTLTAYLQPIATFAGQTGAPIVCNECGLNRWAPNADQFMNDQLGILENLGAGHAVWAWEIAGGINDGEGDSFNFRLGPDPNNLTDVPTNALYGVYRNYWARNRYRPSNVNFQ